MSFVCAICRDYFISSDDISYIRCGHVFHFKCLSQWLNSSNSCPQCRKILSEKKIRKLYITFLNNESNSDNVDCMSVQQKIDSLEFKVLLHEKNMSHYISKNETLEKQNAGLRQEVRKVESEINQKNSVIYNLKEEIRQYKEKFKEYEKLKHKLSYKEKEVDKLRRQFEHPVENSCQQDEELSRFYNTAHLKDTQNTKCTCNKNSTMQETGSQVDSIFKVKFSNTKTEAVTNTFRDKCPIKKKKNSRNYANTDETNDMSIAAKP